MSPVAPILFVGGPFHGRFIAVPDHAVIYIPVGPEPLRVIESSSDSAIADSTIRVETYHRRDLGSALVYQWRP